MMTPAQLRILMQQAGMRNLPSFGRVRSNIGSSSLSITRSAGTGSAGSNWHLATAAAGPFSGVRIFYSSSNNAFGTYDATAVAATGSLSPSPLVPNGGGAWVTTGAVNVPLTGALNSPEYADTGLLPCRSVPRTDGGKYPLLLHRVWTALALPSYSNNANAVAWDASNPQWPVQMFSQGGGNFTASSQSSFGSLTRTTILVPSILQFFYDSARITILGIGDSLMGGDSVIDGSAQRNSYGFKAVRQLQDAGAKLDFVNAGFSGNRFVDFGPRGKKLIDKIKPDAVLIPCYTPNDPASTQAELDAQWWACIDLVNYVVSANALPILVTPTPKNNNTLVQDGLRLQQRDRAKASGFEVFDLEPIVSTQTYPASVCQYKPGLFDDPTHPNGAGNTALGAALASVLRKIF